MSVFIIAAVSYLLGSIPFGFILVRVFRGQDVRLTGSGNIGATNVARSSPALGVLTLVLDALKGLAAVALTRAFFPGRSVLAGVAVLFAIVGHMFPVWLKFRGGKGVATAAGAFFALSPAALLGSVLLFLPVLFFWRYVSLASISASAAMPLLIYILWAPGHAPPVSVTFGALAAAVIIIFKHDANIQRLVQGEEPKFSLGKKRDAA